MSDPYAWDILDAVDDDRQDAGFVGCKVREETSGSSIDEAS